MRVNSEESMRRARLALQRYGSWEAVRKAGTLSRDIKVAQTPLRVVSRPVVSPVDGHISLRVEPMGNPREQGFFYLSRNSGVVNGESFNSRGHMLSEEIAQKGHFLSKETVHYKLLVQATNRATALATEAQKLWDKYEERLKSGELEMLLYLPTYGEGKGQRGASKGSVKVQPRQK